MALYDVGAIVLTEFPSNDGGSFKDRPVLIIAALPFGSTTTDYLVCMITSQDPPDPNMISIVQSDLKRGAISKGWIRPMYMFNVTEADIRRSAGAVTNQKLSEVLDKIHDLICSNG